MLEQLKPGESLAGPAHERLEERELLRREPDLDVASPHAAGCRIEAEIVDHDLGWPLDAAPANQRPQPRKELCEREGLGQVVVGARVETGDPVADPVASRQHQYRRPDARVPSLRHVSKPLIPGSITSRTMAS